jgi:mannosylglycoprotein endo-beta-mannosidase
MLIWKVQNPWSGLRGELYDLFFEPNAGFSFMIETLRMGTEYFLALFGCQSANEPLHVQLNLNTLNYEVVNLLPVSLLIFRT